MSSRPPTPSCATCPVHPAAVVDGTVSLAARLQRTREAERASLARELHDELGAILTAARLDVAWLATRPGFSEPAIAQRLAALQAVLAQGIAIKRRIVEDLSPGVLTHLGLIPALEQLLASHRSRFDGRLLASLDDTVELPPESALALYRIVQESLTNIQRYAHTRTVRVGLGRTRCGRIELDIEDDGCGFDPAEVGTGHHGLAGMRERMLAVGGALEIVSAVGRGTRVRASMPAPRRAGVARRVGRPQEPVEVDLRAAELQA